MEQRYYPRISTEVAHNLETIRRLSQSDAGYFLDPECPYPDSVVELFTVSGAIGSGASGDAAGGEEQRTRDEDSLVGDGFSLNLDNFDQEARRLYTQLRDFGNNIGNADASEKNTYFRLSVTLLEKLLELMERSVGVKRVKEFSELILAIMEDELSPDQRTNIMKRLRESLGD